MIDYIYIFIYKNLAKGSAQLWDLSLILLQIMSSVF